MRSFTIPENMVTKFSPPSGQTPIAVGVTGHRPRRLAGIDLAALAVRIAALLAAIEAAAPGARFRLIGSLAEGADMIAADAALARGWQVDAVLPFPRADYQADFVSHGMGGALDRHLAAVGNTFELPGRRDESGGEAAAYERAGRIVLAQSDLLLAIWDGDPPAGRGGAAQIAAEAVAQGIPVLIADPAGSCPPTLLWSGLNAHGFGPEAIDTVARGDLSTLPRLLAALRAEEEPRRKETRSRWLGRLVTRPLALAYPLLLAATGVRAMRWAGRRARGTAPSPASSGHAFGDRLTFLLQPWFERADSQASSAAQLFRGAFVSNFALAAVAVSLSLCGLATPSALKPLLALAEFASIAAILLITRVGGRTGWHGDWLRCRRLAERLRCLGLSAMLGDLMLREDGLMAGEERAVARRIGLPSEIADEAYLAEVHRRLIEMLDDQIGYLTREAGRMHRLEHRLHRLGGALFVIVALVCATIFAVELLSLILPRDFGEWAHHIPIGVTLLSAALPAIGAAIYGIRMQGDFAGNAERNAALAAQLRGVRTIAAEDPPSFDALLRLVRRTTGLLGQDVGQWFRSSAARPLALPG